MTRTIGGVAITDEGIKAWKVYRKVWDFANSKYKYADTDGKVYLTYKEARQTADERTTLIGEKHVVKGGMLQATDR